ncbi:tripartite tricarboxylate transporter TctB family protein [Plastorhodobacter daqingensis]|uniref:Tripartite tricarboxylate transporter TctB family protein n=1 Tax=Plastorhodobacter daqingensis TaxID=1387281 RepID=A0ABW2UL72_9RHOB
MTSMDHREFAGGLFLTLLGAGFAAHAGSNYPIGTITRMGPGMVPTVLGVLLSLFGIIILVGAFFRTPSRAEIRVFVPLVILSAILAFALLIRPLGLMPAVFACTVIATVAELAFRPVFSLLLGVVLSLAAWLIFVVALQLPIALFNWPF